MHSLTTEFKVGLFVVVAIAIVVGSYVWSFDGVRADEASYTVEMTVGSADGLNLGADVRIAGVDVGSVERVDIEGGRALLTLRIRDAYKLPADSEGALKASGLLGDYFVRLYPGISDEVMPPGGRLRTMADPGDIDEITRNFETISKDLAAITGILREMAEDRNNRDHIESTLANVDALSLELKMMAMQNRGDIDAIVDSVRRLTEALEGYTADIAGDVDEEMDKLMDLTDDLDVSAENMASITGKIDRGEGTIGALVNDDETIALVNETVENVNDAVGSFFGLRPEFYYLGRFYMGSQPADTNLFPTGNELAWSSASTIGFRLRAREDFWYTFEIVDHPQDKVSEREIYREETGSFDRRFVRENGVKFSFQVEKRWGPASFRLGVKEDGGGLGVSFYALRDRLTFHADVFNFSLGAYPAISELGIPNTRAWVRFEPTRNLYIEGGFEQIILGAKHGFATGFLGVGFYFRDDNIRSLLPIIPAAL